MHNILGVASAAGAGSDEAIAEFSRALTLDPESAQTHWHLGAAFASQNRREEALGHLQRSVQLDPDNGSAQHDLGVILAFAGRWDEAANHLERSLALDPGFGGRSPESRRRARGAVAARHEWIRTTLTVFANTHNITRLSAFRPAGPPRVCLPLS